MRSIVVLLLFAATAIADDVLGPAEYMKIMEASKLHYKIGTEPAKTPVAMMNCARRDETTRLVVEKNRKKLIDWTIAPEAKKLLEEGEVLYKANNYAGAAEKYKAALAADPQAVSGYYFLGDTLLFGKNDAAAALEQYQKGIALDPTMPSGHFFASSALVRLGRHDEAREEIIKALTYHPAYESVWKIADKSEQRWNIKPVARFKFEPPAGYLGVRNGDSIDVSIGANGEWLGYAICKAVWANEARFRKQHVEGGWSVEEENACIANQLMGRYNMTEAALDKRGRPKPTNEQIVAAMPPLEQHLWEVAKAQLLDGYILFEVMGQHCPLAISTLSDDAIKQVDAYIRRYVIVARQ
ncbi:MAG TPA: tetratricopeptide repeat protein [Thermoanaerobaculia bacterium]|nr:tetratricopeptide repeat protein [Thermoanaerobaculia bacterium]